MCSAAGPNIFGSHETPAAELSINAQKTDILSDYPAAALIAEADRAHSETSLAVFLDLVNGATGGHDLWIGKYDRQRRTPNTDADLRPGTRVGAGNTAFISRFVQQRQLIVCVAGDKHRMSAALQGVTAEQRHPALVELKTGSLQVQAVHVGSTDRSRPAGNRMIR